METEIREEQHPEEQNAEEKDMEAQHIQEQVAEGQNSEEEQKRPFWKDLLELLLYLLAAFVICLFIVKFIAVRSIVDGSSMNPLLSDRDNLIVQKITYYIHEPERFDVIVFELKNEPGTHYIKRIIGLPGERVQIKEGRVYINGALLEDDTYGNALMEKSYRASSEIILGKNEYFVLGDNRNHSQDSRTVYVGNVNKKQILGKAWIRIWPLSKFGLINK